MEEQLSQPIHEYKGASAEGTEPMCKRGYLSRPPRQVKRESQHPRKNKRINS